MFNRIKYWLGFTNYHPNYKGHRPSNKQIQFIIDNLQKYVDNYPEARLDMLNSSVNNYGHICGTVHCHAGNYAVQALIDGRLSDIVDYTHGVHLMVIDLGFEESYDLKIWASMNKRLWGNKWGVEMFIEPSAFSSEKRPKGAKNNQDIVDHWKEVLKRNY